MRLLAAVFLTFFILPALACAGPLEDGQAAYARKDYATALKILRPLADQGDAAAQVEVGDLYGMGWDGVKRDYAEALKWHRKAAERGDARGQVAVGSAYFLGQGVEKDYAEAMKWWRKAADQGSTDAQGGVAAMYERGEGVKQDYAEAVRWWRKGADQGFSDSQFKLGEMYEKGWGVKQDYEEAYFWLVLGLTTMPGPPPGYETIAKVAEHLTPEQKYAADKRVADWKKAHLAPAAAPPKQ